MERSSTEYNVNVLQRQLSTVRSDSANLSSAISAKFRLMEHRIVALEQRLQALETKPGLWDRVIAAVSPTHQAGQPDAPAAPQPAHPTPAKVAAAPQPDRQPALCTHTTYPAGADAIQIFEKGSI